LLDVATPASISATLQRANSLKTEWAKLMGQKKYELPKPKYFPQRQPFQNQKVWPHSVFNLPTPYKSAETETAVATFNKAFLPNTAAGQFQKYPPEPKSCITRTKAKGYIFQITIVNPFCPKIFSPTATIPILRRFGPALFRAVGAVFSRSSVRGWLKSKPQRQPPIASIFGQNVSPTSFQKNTL